MPSGFYITIYINFYVERLSSRKTSNDLGSMFVRDLFLDCNNLNSWNGSQTFCVALRKRARATQNVWDDMNLSQYHFIFPQPCVPLSDAAFVNQYLR